MQAFMKTLSTDSATNSSFSISLRTHHTISSAEDAVSVRLLISSCSKEISDLTVKRLMICLKGPA